MPEAIMGVSLYTFGALLFTAAALAVAGLHLCLVIGLPFGRMTMGGRHRGVLPAPMRIGSAVQGVLILYLALIVAKLAGLVETALVPDWSWLIWLPVGISVVSFFLNTFLADGAERAFGMPATLALVIGSLAVALSK